MPELYQIRPAQPPRGWAPLALGFRPFFLVAALWALVAMARWFWLILAQVLQRPLPGFDPGWHGHALLAGYGGAVIAGFLLTAVRNWTGAPTPTGGLLALLVAWWGLDRLGGVVPVVGPYGALWWWGVAAAIAWPIYRTRNRRNYRFPPYLVLLGLADLWWHLGGGRPALLALLDGFVVLIGAVGGRVIPFFTQRAVPGARPRRTPILERLAEPLLVALWLLRPWAPAGFLAGVAAVAAVVHLVRLGGWWHPGVRRLPILWVLFVGYAWLPLALGLEALALVGVVPASSAVHATTVGVLGIVTYGMMTRVALGHTGRPLVVARPIVWGYRLLALAALVRVLAPWLDPRRAAHHWLTAALAWLAAFAIFAVVYTPILLRKRIDGRPG